MFHLNIYSVFAVCHVLCNLMLKNMAVFNTDYEYYVIGKCYFWKYPMSYSRILWTLMLFIYYLCAQSIDTCYDK